jgi:hypothetical protein
MLIENRLLTDLYNQPFEFDMQMEKSSKYKEFQNRHRGMKLSTEENIVQSDNSFESIGKDRGVSRHP